jgi:tetratricopeptide (TPR) repeat protein
MNYQMVLARILATVDDNAYLVPTAHIETVHREALKLIQRAIHQGEPVADIRNLAKRLLAENALDEVHFLSAMHVISASPQVKDYRDAARWVAEQELAALNLGGPHLNDNLASVERHRGVLAFLHGHYEAALDYFTRALERQRTPENMGNVLCVLLRLGESDEAEQLLNHLTTVLPDPFAKALWERVNCDPDLSTLRPTGK